MGKSFKLNHVPNPAGKEAMMTQEQFLGRQKLDVTKVNLSY